MYKTKKGAERAAKRWADAGYMTQIDPEFVVGGAFGSPAKKPGTYYRLKHWKGF